MEKKKLIFLAILFLIVLASRLFFTIGTENFSPDAYFNIRIMEDIQTHGTIIGEDPLSYGGRTFVTSPLYYYMLAGISTSAPILLKFLPQLFISLLPLIVFFIIETMTERFNAAAIGASISAFIPILFSKTLFSLSPLTLAIPLTFLALLLFTQQKKSSTIPFIIVTVALALIHPSSIFFILALLGYLILLTIERMTIEKAEVELAFFSTFLFLWIQFLIFKRAFLAHGAAIIWQNIPTEILSRYFIDVTLLLAIIQLGILPLLGGIYSIYKYLFKVKNKYIYMYVSLALTVSIFIWLRLIQPTVGFMYLGVCLSILGGPALVKLMVYAKKMRFAYAKTTLTTMIAVLFIVTMVLPSFDLAREEQQATVSPQLYNAMLWLQNETRETSTVLSTAQEGHLVTAIAERKNVVDDYFLLIENAEKKLSDAGTMFTTTFPTEAIRLFDEYDVDYIVVSDMTRKRYNINDLPYKELDCLHPVFNEKDVKIYVSQCKIEVAS